MTVIRRLVAVAAAAVVGVGLSAAAAAFEPVAAPSAFPERVLGSPDAPVTVVEYSSLTCPACAGFHTEVMPRLKADFVDTGKVRIIYRDFPLDNLALGAAVIARCAPEEMYFPLLDMLYANQQQWSRSSKPLAAIMGYGRLAGLSEDAVNACLSDEALVIAVQEVRERGAQTYGINSTPSFVVNGEVVAGNQGYDRFAEIFRKHGAD